MKHVVLPLLVLIAAAGCATGPKPCTPEWIDMKVGRLLDSFAKNHSQQIEGLRRTTAGFQVGDPPGATEAGLALGHALLLGLEFISDAAPEVNSVLEQCPTSTSRSRLIADMLRRQGFGEGAAKWVEDLGTRLDRRS